MDSDTKNNFQDQRISDFTFQYRFPYPISAAYHQMKVAIEPIKKVILVQDTFAAFLQYLAVVSICEYLSTEHQSPKIDDMLQEMNRPSLGQWLGIFREVQDWFTSREHRQVMEELGELWTQGRFRTEFLRDANSLLNLRNEFSHGKAPINETLADRLLQDEKQCLYKLLKPFIFLNKYPFGYVDGLKYQEWKFQGFFHKAMGSDSSFPTLPITFEKPIEEQTLFLMSKDLDGIIQLKPFYVFATCPKCDLDHVFAFNQIQHEKLKYISVLHRHELVEEKDPASRTGKGFARLHELLGRKVEVKPMCSVSIPEKMKRCIVLPQLTVKEGNVLAGKYEVLGLINQGGMGDVFMGRHVSLDKTVAVKIMRQDLARENRYVTRFHREARMLAKMMHPNIVKVLDNGIDEDCNFIIEEFVPNGDLSDRLARDGAVAEDQAIAIVRDAARGLAHAHANGLIHRDIKPSNILFREDGAAVLTDFGIAKDTSALTMLTATADIMGTSQYMSPEQREGADITPATDIYSLGVVLFEMLGGRPGLEKVRIDSLKGVSKPTLELIGKMLAPIGQRPNDGMELLKLIERLKNGIQSEPGPDMPLESVQNMQIISEDELRKAKWAEIDKRLGIVKEEKKPAVNKARLGTVPKPIAEHKAGKRKLFLPIAGVLAIIAVFAFLIASGKFRKPKESNGLKLKEGNGPRLTVKSDAEGAEVFVRGKLAGIIKDGKLEVPNLEQGAAEVKLVIDSGCDSESKNVYIEGSETPEILVNFGKPRADKCNLIFEIKELLIKQNISEQAQLLYNYINIMGQLESDYLYSKDYATRQYFVNTQSLSREPLSEIKDLLIGVDKESNDYFELNILYNNYIEKDKELWEAIDSGDGTLAAKLIFEVMPGYEVKVKDKLKNIIETYGPGKEELLWLSREYSRRSKIQNGTVDLKTRQILKMLIRQKISEQAQLLFEYLDRSWQLESDYLYSKDEPTRDKFNETVENINECINTIKSLMMTEEGGFDEYNYMSQLESFYNDYKSEDKELWAAIDSGDGTRASKIIFEILPEQMKNITGKVKEIKGKYSQNLSTLLDKKVQYDLQSSPAENK